MSTTTTQVASWANGPMGPGWFMLHRRVVAVTTTDALVTPVRGMGTRDWNSPFQSAKRNQNDDDAEWAIVMMLLAADGEL